MKKNLLRIVCILMALFMLPVHAFAAEAPAQEEALTGAAATNYVQKNADFVGSEYRTVTTSQNNRLEFIVDIYTKTETVGLTRNGETEYATTTYEVWNTRGNNSVSNSGSDRYGYAILSASLHYTQSVKNGVTFSQMTRMTGSYTIITSGAELASHRYVLYEKGITPSLNTTNYSRSYSVSTASPSWSSNISSSLFPGISTSANDSHQYARYYYTISSTETGDTWGSSFDLIVYYNHS